ncbi:class I SAM-dependent methyltransferase [Sulfitobacter sabulilitoris]|uniref:Class I SAM-dependent methyltransferase n=1 Tax=Sulfitobacter sabulilitoris TaxID=2562655 RepID=A0A5S3QBW4_9RHOB|nr:class I SAM-dependent methyltransferase [Sulfitobacter sabulilitoris]TMM54572.1 class I SAM-dependent methyltransferase [Sulfitobacter sabulilitoris]
MAGAPSNADQAEFWSSASGLSWVTHAAEMDATFRPVLDGLLQRAAIARHDRVLDLGCGAGASTRAVAERVGPAGFVLGADISPPLVQRAAERLAGLPQARVICADAAVHPFTDDFDHVVSRFGSMFFADPVAGFVNLAAALRPGGRMTLATWGEIAANPWFTLPARAAKAVLGAPPKSDPDAPGPFSLRDPAQIASVLRQAGLGQIATEVTDLHLTVPGDLRDAAELCTRIGPAAGTLRHFGGDETARLAIRDGIIEAFAGFRTATGVRVPAQVNFVTATRPV